MKYRPRNDYVLIRRVAVGFTPGGVAVGDVTIEGVQHIVEAVGPEVDDLEEGDRVLIIGTNREDYGFLPNSKDLLITKQQNVVLVYEDE